MEGMPGMWFQHPERVSMLSCMGVVFLSPGPVSPANSFLSTCEDDRDPFPACWKKQAISKAS